MKKEDREGEESDGRREEKREREGGRGGKRVSKGERERGDESNRRRERKEREKERERKEERGRMGCLERIRTSERSTSCRNLGRCSANPVSRARHTCEPYSK